MCMYVYTQGPSRSATTSPLYSGIASFMGMDIQGAEDRTVCVCMLTLPFSHESARPQTARLLIVNACVVQNVISFPILILQVLFAW